MDTSANLLSPLPGGRRRGLHQIGSLLALPAILALAGCVTEQSAITGQRQSYGYSWEQELQLGAEADKELTREMGLYEHPQLQAYVESVGQRVLQHSDVRGPNAPEMYRNAQFTFRVIDNPTVNAFAIPGGYVYVTRGLLAHAQNEAQLAVVLGHEIAHVAARHSSQMARRAQISQIGLIAGAILGQTVLGDRIGDMGSLLNLGSQTLELVMMRYSREAEHESDQLGVTYAQSAGYAAAESARFFTSLQRISEAEGRGGLPTWQSTHPDPGDRANRVRQLAAAGPRPTAGALTVGEEQFLRQIEGMVMGDDPREGFTQAGMFYHPTLRFQMPVAPGWKVDNQKAAVLMAEPNGRAMMGLQLARENRAPDAAAKFAQESGVQVVASSNTSINGLPATVIVGQGDTQQGTLGVWNAFIEYEGRVYSLMGLAPAQVFTEVRPTFESVTGGFGPLRDMSLTQVQPARLRLVRADRNAPFSSFVPASLPPGITPEKLAIINQVEVNEPVSEGRILKIPDTSLQPGQGAAPAAHPAYSVPPPHPPTGPVYSQPPPHPPTGPVYSQPPPYPPHPGQPPQTYPPQYPQQSPGQPPAYPQQSPGQPPVYPQQSPGYPPPGYPPPPAPPPQQGQPPVWPR
jgi:predicted Zn-dependent protease